MRCRNVEHPDTPNPARPSGPRPAAPAPEDVIHWPRLVYNDEIGGVCLVSQRQVSPGASAGILAREAEQRWLAMFALYDMCPGATRPGASPQAVARQVIEEFLPAAARPEIDPGYAITGRPAYLETNGNLHPATDRRATELGEIEVTFRGTYDIDWGDGTRETHTTEGAAWPDGKIVHTYVDMGTYDVVVAINWVADWRIGATTGRIDNGLVSTATLDDFDVRQLQAVRDA